MLRKSLSVDSFVKLPPEPPTPTPSSPPYGGQQQQRPLSPPATSSMTAPLGILTRQTRGNTDPPKHQQYFASAPLPPLPPVGGGNGGRARGESITSTTTTNTVLSDFDQSVQGGDEDDGLNRSFYPPPSSTAVRSRNSMSSPSSRHPPSAMVKSFSASGIRSSATYSQQPRRGTTASLVSTGTTSSSAGVVVSPTLSTMSSMSSILSGASSSDNSLPHDSNDEDGSGLDSPTSQPISHPLNSLPPPRQLHQQQGLHSPAPRRLTNAPRTSRTSDAWSSGASPSGRPPVRMSIDTSLADRGPLSHPVAGLSHRQHIQYQAGQRRLSAAGAFHDRVVLAVVGMPGCGKSTAIRKGLNGYDLSEAKPVPIQLGAGLFNFTRRIGRVPINPAENVPPCELQVLEIDAPPTLSVPESLATVAEGTGMDSTTSTAGIFTATGPVVSTSFSSPATAPDPSPSTSSAPVSSSSTSAPGPPLGYAHGAHMIPTPAVWQDDAPQLDAVIICYDSRDEKSFGPVLGLVSAYRAMNLPTLVFACKSDKGETAPLPGTAASDSTGPVLLAETDATANAATSGADTLSSNAHLTATTSANTSSSAGPSTAAVAAPPTKVGIEPVRALEVIKAFDVGLVEVTVKTELGKDKLRKSFHFMLKTIFRERHKNANGGSEEGFGYRNPASPDIIRPSQSFPWEQSRSADSSRTNTPQGGPSTGMGRRSSAVMNPPLLPLPPPPRAISAISGGTQALPHSHPYSYQQSQTTPRPGELSHLPAQYQQPPISQGGRGFGLGSPTRVRSMGDLMSEHERSRYQNHHQQQQQQQIIHASSGASSASNGPTPRASHEHSQSYAAGSRHPFFDSAGSTGWVVSPPPPHLPLPPVTDEMGRPSTRDGDDSNLPINDPERDMDERELGISPTTVVSALGGSGPGVDEGEEGRRDRATSNAASANGSGGIGRDDFGKLSSTQWATLDELLDKLLFLAVSGDDPAFVTHFLLTYRRFATPRSVLLAMQKRMRQLDNPSGDPMFACFAQMRICNLLEQWIRDYPHDFAVRGTAGALAALIKSIIAKTYMLHYGCEFLPFLELLPSLVDKDSAWACKPDGVSETDASSDEYVEDEDEESGAEGPDEHTSDMDDPPPVSPERQRIRRDNSGRAQSQNFGDGVTFGEFGLEELGKGINGGDLATAASPSASGDGHGPASAGGVRERKGSLPLSNKSLASSSVQNSQASSQQQQQHMQSSLQQQQELQQQQPQAHASMYNGMVLEMSPKQLIKELVKVATEFNALDSSHIAEEITRLEVTMFLEIEPRAWLHYTFVSGKKDPQADFIAGFNEVSNHLADWVVSLILCHDRTRQRVRQVEKFVEVAQKLRELNNYSALRAFVAGIHNASYEGDPMMEQFRQKCPDHAKNLQSWEILLQQRSSHRAYRMALKNTKGPCIPAQEVHMQDLIKTHAGNPDFHEVDPTKIHWGKFHLLGKFITTTTECQQQCRNSSLYEFPLRQHIQNLLLREYLMNEDMQKSRIAAPELDDDYVPPAGGGGGGGGGGGRPHPVYPERSKDVALLKKIFFW